MPITGRLQWVKLHVRELLFGTTISELEPAERWVFIGFLALAGDSPEPGSICIRPGVPYEEHQLAGLLGVELATLQSAVDKMIEHGKISLNGKGCFEMVNFERYQGASRRDDYMREYMPPYMRNVYRPRQKQKQRELEEVLNLNVKQSNVKPKQVKVKHVKQDQTRPDQKRTDETRPDKTRPEDEDVTADAPEAAVLKIHKRHFGSNGIDTNSFREKLTILSMYPLERVEELYQRAMSMAKPPRFPAGYVLAQLEDRDGREFR